MLFEFHVEICKPMAPLHVGHQLPLLAAALFVSLRWRGRKKDGAGLETGGSQKKEDPQFQARQPLFKVSGCLRCCKCLACAGSPLLRSSLAPTLGTGVALNCCRDVPRLG